ncbi:hypothetical protein O3M35_008190 [Rhynocoris fuscipes]|uniref:RRM domain-containing protein n=1 Tax=Rhynocoris fuscipes TaxID=488301 RepID=A0AAW1D671_9HEMI
MTKMNVDVPSSGENSKTNLIINFLPQDMTQGGFIRLCQTAGEIDSFKLVKDKDTGINLGYGFVNYCKPEDAANALKILNGKQISNKTIKVSYARPDAPKSINLFVSGLPATTNLQEVEKLFGDYGRIMAIRLLLDEKMIDDTGNNKVNVIAFVRLEEKSDAERAIKELNGFIPAGSKDPLTVEYPNENAKKLNASIAEYMQGKTPVKNTPFTPYLPVHLQGTGGKTNVIINKGLNRFSPIGNIPVAKTFPVNQGQGHVVYVFGLGEDAGDADLWELFGPFGPVQSAKVVRDPILDKCKGFGFVTMTNHEDAVKAIRVLNGYPRGDRRLQVSFKTKKTAAKNFVE